MSVKVHLDGYNFLPYLTGQEKKGPRNEFFYFGDEAELTALRYDNWKLIFAEQRAPGTLRVWAEPFTELRVPLMFNLRTDPYERAQITSNTYYDWLFRHAFLLMHIGRRPIAAFGNSDGDLQMLQWTAAGSGARFCLYS